MSELDKLLSQESTSANSAIPAKEGSENSRNSKISSPVHPKTDFHGTAELRLLAGDDWPEISADPAQLAAFKAAAAIAEQIQRGEVPEHYTATTECSRCGPVPIFPGAPTKVSGCPWCFNRRAGRPIPLAKVHPGSEKGQSPRRMWC